MDVWVLKVIIDTADDDFFRVECLTMAGDGFEVQVDRGDRFGDLFGALRQRVGGPFSLLSETDLFLNNLRPDYPVKDIPDMTQEHGKPLNGRPVRALIWHCRSGEECRGNGDQIRGLSTALYLAIATSRVLLLEWSRNGADITDLFSIGGIDWRVPVGLDCQSETELTWWAVK
ncbi:unnamed protein product, partial [Prorocentrum cordatum]